VIYLSRLSRLLIFRITGIKRTKLRLVRCRARMAMNDRERLQDARADQNLVDVTRYPAPWEVRSDDVPITPPANT
jgi:serine/threonine-protein kinase ULK2